MKNCVLFLAFLSAIFTGCSKALPTSPAETPEFVSSMMSDIGILGNYQLKFDTRTMTAELTPGRNSSPGESFIVSGLKPFTAAPCTDCLSLVSIYRQNNPGDQYDFTLKLRHPFEKGNTALPPSAKTRLDLDIFDPALVIYETAGIPTSFPRSNTSVNTLWINNPDGFTGDLKEIMGLNTIAPFVLIQDDSKEVPIPFKHHNKLGMGEEKNFDVELYLLYNTTFYFDMFLTFGYRASANFQNRLDPHYYNPEFNRKVAWNVNASTPGVWFKYDNTAPTDVIVEVCDWKIGATVNPNLINPTDVYASSEVAFVSVEILGMTNSLPGATIPFSGSGTPSDPLICKISVSNEKSLSSGTYLGLVKVQDIRPPLQVTDGRDFLVHTQDALCVNSI